MHLSSVLQKYSLLPYWCVVSIPMFAYFFFIKMYSPVAWNHSTKTAQRCVTQIKKKLYSCNCYLHLPTGLLCLQFSLSLASAAPFSWATSAVLFHSRLPGRSPAGWRGVLTGGAAARRLAARTACTDDSRQSDVIRTSRKEIMERAGSRIFFLAVILIWFYTYYLRFYFCHLHLHFLHLDHCLFFFNWHLCFHHLRQRAFNFSYTAPPGEQTKECFSENYMGKYHRREAETPETNRFASKAPQAFYQNPPISGPSGPHSRIGAVLYFFYILFCIFFRSECMALLLQIVLPNRLTCNPKKIFCIAANPLSICRRVCYGFCFPFPLSIVPNVEIIEDSFPPVGEVGSPLPLFTQLAGIPPFNPRPLKCCSLSLAFWIVRTLLLFHLLSMIDASISNFLTPHFYLF